MCKACNGTEYLLHKCRYCGEYFCSEHMLPENHRCPGLTRVRM
ncbi:MAG: AN1-type zinc finger domain-containing protein [Candidatus Bathyarchaeia archaeon]